MTTYPNFCRTGPTNLRSRVTRDQYQEAAHALEALGLGCQLTITKNNKKLVAFVKKRPGEVKKILESNPNLCNVEEYAMRFALAISANMINYNQGLRQALVTYGYGDYIQVLS